MNRSTVLLKMILTTFIMVSCINSTPNPENKALLLEAQNLLEKSSKSAKKRVNRYLPIKYTQLNMLMAVTPIFAGWFLSNNVNDNVF